MRNREDADDRDLLLAGDGFEATVKPVAARWDDDEVDREASTYFNADHGPDPVPDWVITDDAARQYDHGLLKTGKEADVYLVERRIGDRVNMLAAKRYRAYEERLFRDDARYRQGKRTGIRRVDLAVAKGTRKGMMFRAHLWVTNEFETLSRLWSAGAPVPYPVQLLGNELMLEYFGDDDDGAAPRLVHARLDRDGIHAMFEQCVDALRAFARAGVVHADLSPYNMLVWKDRLVVIDFPQAVDPYTNSDGLALLHRDVTNACTWFARRGVQCDIEEIYADLVSRTLG